MIRARFVLASSLALLACSSTESSSPPSGSTGAAAADGGKANGTGDGADGEASDGGSGTSSRRDSGAGAKGCEGKTVDSVAACAAPCAYNEFLDSSEGPGPNGGQIWCAGTCTTDADCTVAGEICDRKGPTLPHLCVRSCDGPGICADFGLPECGELNDGRKACF